VLGDFRDRLLVDGRADRLLDLALARLKEAGLVRDRATAHRLHPRPGGGARPDPAGAGHRGGARRLEELARTAGHALEGLAGDAWGRRYGRLVRLGKNPTRPKSTSPRPPTAFQDYLDQHDIQRLRSWRAVS